MLVLTLLLPLLSFTILGLFGRLIGSTGAKLFSTSLIGSSLLVAFIGFYDVAFCGSVVRVNFFPWFEFGPINQTWGFLFDAATASMLIVVLSVSFLVHMYSGSYMSADPFIVRFMSYLSLFTFFMLVFVTSDNCLQMFLGWEGVGLASYLLINFWFTRLPANRSAIKAVIVNRFGDFALIVSLMLVFVTFKSFDYGLIFAIVPSFSDFYIVFFVWEIHLLSILSFFLFIGCVGKSAQMGLHTWLPDAMEGPTPVSALIHAATMVTAGVFLLIRFSPVLEFSSSVLSLIALIGAFTALFAGTAGIFQNDLKRVVAYSTCSQLGYMVLACGLSNYSLSLFHLLNHAFFKALLFLSAGAVIHAVLDEQDMRRMGGLIRLLPLTYVCFLIGSLALMGFPYTSGFYSKDFILEVAYSSYFSGSAIAYWLGLMAAACTAFYSSRLLYLTFLGETNLKKRAAIQVHEPDFLMTFPLVTLGFASIFIGYVLKDAYIGMGTHFLSAVSNQRNDYFDVFGLASEFAFSSDKLVPVLVSLLSGFLACFLYSVYPMLFQTVSIDSGTFQHSVYRFFNKKWFFDQVYTNYLVLPFLKIANSFSFKSVDRGLIELVGPTGLVRFWLNLVPVLSNWQSGFIFNYVFSMVVGVICFVFMVKLSFVVPRLDFVVYAVLFFGLAAYNVVRKK